VPSLRENQGNAGDLRDFKMAKFSALQNTNEPYKLFAETLRVIYWGLEWFPAAMSLIKL